MGNAAANHGYSSRRAEIYDSASVPIPLVLTDVHMPDMDGFDLAAEIRRRGDTAKIVLMTSGSHADDIARYRELKIDAYLTKPVSQKELQAAILRVLKPPRRRANRSGPASRGTPSPQPHRAASPLRILLAEDNLVNQTVAQRMLEREGHQVVVVGNGLEALATLDRETFQLILMDIQMPLMDGFEATAAIRERERLTGGRVPIVAMTAHAMTGDKDRCLTAGMDGYIAKPVSKAELKKPSAASPATGPAAFLTAPALLDLVHKGLQTNALAGSLGTSIEQADDGGLGEVGSNRGNQGSGHRAYHAVDARGADDARRSSR